MQDDTGGTVCTGAGGQWSGGVLLYAGGTAFRSDSRAVMHRLYACQRVTVSWTGTPLLLPPEEAVTVTVEVPAGVPVAGALPPELTGGVDESLLLQLASAITRTKSHPVHRPWSSTRRRYHSPPISISPKGVNVYANIVGELPGDNKATGPPSVLIVRVVFTGPPAGVTVAGLNLHAVPVGNPEQAKLTG